MKTACTTMLRGGARTCVLLIALTSAASAAPPALHFDPSYELTIDSLAPGGAAVVFAIVREREGWLSRTRAHERVMVDLDRDGTISVAAAEMGFGPRSLWTAVDLGTGALGIAMPGNPPLVQRAVEPTRLTATPGHLHHVSSELRVLVVRPGRGAWTGSVFDGGSADRSPADDGAVLVRLDALVPLAGSGGEAYSLAGLEPRDVVIGIEPTTLAFFHYVNAPAGVE